MINFWICLQESLCVLPSLADALIPIGIPCPALLDSVVVCGQIQDIALPRYPLSIDDVELRFFEGRSNLILHYPHPGSATDDFLPLLDRRYPPNI